MKKKIKLTEQERELIESGRTLKTLDEQHRSFPDLWLYVWQLFEEWIRSKD